MLIRSPLRSQSSCNLRACQLLRLAVDLSVVHMVLVFRNAECKMREDMEVPQPRDACRNCDRQSLERWWLEL